MFTIYREVLVEHVEMIGSTVVTWYSWVVVEDVVA
jgi:hypothetical protein